MNDTSKKAVTGITAAIVIGCVAAGVTYFATESQAYVAKVNGATIRSADFDKLYAGQKAQAAQQYGIDFKSAQGHTFESSMKKNIVSQLVQKQIILNEAKSRNLSISDADVDKKLNEVKKPFPNDEAFKKALNQHNLTLDELKRNIRESLTAEAVMKAVTKDTKVTDADVKAYYDKNAAQFKKPEEVSASHILVKDQKVATTVLKAVKAGGNFGELAKKYSEDPGSKANGGSLGFFGKGRMVPDFEKTAFALKPGEVSGLVKTQFGYHIIKGGERHAAHVQPFDEVKGELKERVFKEQQQKAFGTWMAAQQTAAKVEYKPGFDPKVPDQPSAPVPLPGEFKRQGGVPAGAPPANGPPGGAKPAAPAPAQKK